MAGREHWEEVYTAKAEDQVSWFQERPTCSLELIRATGLGPAERLVDVGGGASRLVDALLEEGYRDITVVDIAGTALAQARARLGARAAAVAWRAADVLAGGLGGPFALWHDRAVFHFLTAAEQRARYREVLEAEVPPGGQVIIATFAHDGPERCSGLPVARYTPEELAAELGPGCELLETRAERHRTPAGALQSFIFCRFRRR
ncbi:methyltransferase domain-containing protein [Thioalbus denitrificans]|uniref:Methyltransferase domain-containing protein n=1 Tax=Thioalbus denitrificans TaxID=547122 RepID=A0A369CGY4_9GAMM|nr:methyltransferase domain-containing protein [Thioalbus denitrificans]RCX33340.1 hypothetical protein DFQ59_101641 [Thioalbus denitrificans]